MSGSKIIEVLTQASEFGDVSYCLIKTEFELVRSGNSWSMKVVKGRPVGTQVQICWMDYNTKLRMWGLKLKLPVPLDEGTRTDKLDLPRVDGMVEVREIWESKVGAKVPEISFSPTDFLKGDNFSERNLSFHDALKALEKIAIAILLRHCKLEEAEKEAPGDRFRSAARRRRSW